MSIAAGTNQNIICFVMVSNRFIDLVVVIVLIGFRCFISGMKNPRIAIRGFAKTIDAGARFVQGQRRSRRLCGL